EPGEAPEADRLMEAVRGSLARFKHPVKLLVIDSLPRNAMGKVQKNVLRERFGDVVA
ncbi:MAG: malonyl-CoA synthase, partial [Erythrobacter sp.]|nr:malonyl-CoA synthase [Erythrobacter sp.]